VALNRRYLFFPHFSIFHQKNSVALKRTTFFLGSHSSHLLFVLLQTAVCFPFPIPSMYLIAHLACHLPVSCTSFSPWTWRQHVGPKWRGVTTAAWTVSFQSLTGKVAMTVPRNCMCWTALAARVYIHAVTLSRVLKKLVVAQLYYLRHVIADWESVFNLLYLFHIQ
jgi:hypothetical protein